MSESASGTHVDLLTFSVGSHGRLIMESMIVSCSLCLIHIHHMLRNRYVTENDRTTSAGCVGVNKTHLLSSLSLRLPEPVLISFFFFM